MTPDPKVSVIIAAYNSMPFIQESLVSLARQPYRPLEVIVVDDGSVDGTPRHVAGLEDSLKSAGLDFLLLRNSCNRGVAHARNRGLRAACGDFLTMLDHDDIMLPHGIANRVEFALREGADVVYARRNTLIDNPGVRRVEHRVEPYHTDGFTRLQSGLDQFKYLLRERVTFGHATLLYHQRVLGRVGFFDEARELMGMEHNGWLLKLFNHFFAHYLNEPVFLIRRGHRTDHLATVWDGHPDRNLIFDTVLVPRALAELGEGRL